MPEIHYAAKHEGQKRVAEVWDKSKCIVIVGEAGTGKTSCALGNALSRGENVILCRPAVPVEEDLGFIPGDLNEKLLPWMAPFADVLGTLGGKKLELWKTIEFVSIGLLGGRTVTDATLIIDECQNATYRQIKMALTRVGKGGRVVLCGDYSQTELTGPNPLRDISERLSQVEGAAVIHFLPTQQLRDPFVRRVLEVL